MINKLTKKQKEMFNPWVDKWIKIGLSTEEANWKLFEENVKKCYIAAKLNPNVPIVRVQSPIVGVFASSIADNIVNNSAVNSAVSSAVGSEVSFVVDSAVDSAVRSAVRSAVDYAVSSAVGYEVDSAVYSAVDSAVESAVYSGVSSAVGSEVSSDVKWHYWIGGSFWSGWQSFISFFTDVCNLKFSPEITKRANAYRACQESAGYWWPNKHFIMVCNHPKKIHLKNNKLHNENGMAIYWPDGWGLYLLNGVRMSKDIVMTPADKLDCKLILKEKNAEIRKEIVKKIGVDRVIKELNTEIIDKHNDYQLLLLDLQDGRKRPYLKMINPSTGDIHIEGVHPDCKTVRQAINFRWGGESIYKVDWKPEILT